jgi:ribonuclease E
VGAPSVAPSTDTEAGAAETGAQVAEDTAIEAQPELEPAALLEPPEPAPAAEAEAEAEPGHVAGQEPGHEAEEQVLAPSVAESFAVPEPEAKPVRRARRRAAPALTFQAPDPVALMPVLRDEPPAPPVEPAETDLETAIAEDDLEAAVTGDDVADIADEDFADGAGEDDGAPRRRRRRGRRGRGRVRDDDGEAGADEPAEAAGEGEPADQGAGDGAVAGDESESSDAEHDGQDGQDGQGSSRRRRTRQRRKRGSGEEDEASTSRSGDDEIRGVNGSTRLEAKRQRRRESRDTSRRRVPVVTEAEFLARRESVNRVMVVRNAGERTQIAVLEDGVLVEHYVTRASSSSYAGNVYVGRVQNVLPSMEAAFVDIGKGRNGVLYAGEVNYDASGLEGKPRKIEQALKPGQAVVVQVTKDPIGHKGARLTSQVSLPGRYMVYVPEGGSAGISRKLPDSERTRLRSILKKITPEDAGVIVRTAAEGASEDELSRDITRLAAQWDEIQKKSTKGTPPTLLYAEPDLVIRVIRDIFNEDFNELVIQGDREWEMIESYVSSVAPDLLPRLRREPVSSNGNSAGNGASDVFAEHRIDEQLLKALDRKVYLPSGGSLIFDRTEAMTVVDVNTGRFTGKGGNLEETVTKNNLEAAEELVRQLRLRDVGGIIVVDFIDMVLESNRELVLRRLTECLGRDRTKHQVAEVTSLGLVQMTRKRVGQGLLEAYSEPCPTCGGRGHTIELPGLGGAKPRPKPVPRPPLARPAEESDTEAVEMAEPVDAAEAVDAAEQVPEPDPKPAPDVAQAQEPDEEQVEAPVEVLAEQ